MPIKIIIDTNFLFVPFQFNIDIMREMEEITNRKIEAILLSPVYNELKFISETGGIKAKQAKVALKYSERLKRLDIELKPSETVDDLIVHLASEWRCPVATNDRELRKRLENINTSIIYVRKRSHLEIKGKIYWN